MPLILKNGKKIDNTKVIAINCQSANPVNWWRLHYLNDPGNQIDFLEHELTELQKVGGKAIIISHFSLGDYLDSFSRRYWSLLDRFQDTVRFQFAGHTHNEEFHVHRGILDEKAINWIFVAGSLTNKSGKNPGFSVIELDAEHLVPVNIDTYMMNLTLANIEDKANWSHFHNWADSYKVEDLRPSNLRALATRMQTDEALAIEY